MNLDQILTEYKALIDAELERCLTFPECKQQRLLEAMRYSVNAGGKRIRAILTLEFAKLCGGSNGWDIRTVWGVGYRFERDIEA